jgi:predicted MPP superfamily phosphohydrolase
MTPGLGTSKIKRTGSFLLLYRRAVAHWRAIILLLILARVAFLVASSDEFVSFELNLFALLLIFIASQVFWIGRIVDLSRWLFPDQPRVRLVVIADLVYLFVIAYSFPTTIGQGHTFRTAYYGLSNVVFEAVFWWWFVGSMLAFALVVFFGTVERTTRVAAWAYRKARQSTKGRVAAASSGVAEPVSPDRRHFLEQTAVLISATPFIAAGYGLLYERQNVEIVRQRVQLARLPKAFEGFHIAQLSDIHISPFTTADYIHRCVSITNELKPDLIALTGDYIAWDTEQQGEVVRTLAGLRARFGVFGCLGNHEEESGTEESITRLFTAQGIQILREARAPIVLGGETLNLIGTDDPNGQTQTDYQGDLHRKLRQIKDLMMPEAVNILLSHGDFPDMFDRVAELGIDLMLAGHTHGGQLSLDFVHRGLNLSHLIYDYTSGWYEKNGAQLYVNRGIGTTGFPIRLGARPEITVFELTRRV